MQRERINVRWGQVNIASVAFIVPIQWGSVDVAVRIDGREFETRTQHSQTTGRILTRLTPAAKLSPNQTLEIEYRRQQN